MAELRHAAMATVEDLRTSGALRDRLATGPVVVSFYRGAWCPYCNTELQALQGSLEAIKDRGASLVAISPQAPDASLSLVERLGLGFDVLSDLDQSVTRAYQLQFELAPALQAIYPKLGMDLTHHNADGTWHLPVPGHVRARPRRCRTRRHVDPSYLERMPVDDIVAALDSVRRP
jgi:thiol-disulfide isomerase/thioredoxin